MGFGWAYDSVATHLRTSAYWPRGWCTAHNVLCLPLVAAVGYGAPPPGAYPPHGAPPAGYPGGEDLVMVPEGGDHARPYHSPTTRETVRMGPQDMVANSDLDTT